MDENISNLHFLLLKQLKRSNLKQDEVPSEFLSRISRTYFDHEQERYLLERSMEISSREMMDLNEKLEIAQKIAHLGYWFYDKNEDKLVWSKETFNITGLNPAEGMPTLQYVLELIHGNDRIKLVSSMDLAFRDGKDFEIEIRLKNLNTNKYKWYYAKGHSYINSKNLSNSSSINKPAPCLSGILIDINDRKESEENLNKIHQQLLSISRQAGMAEVATSVLHNIGNILNSANISVSCMAEIINQSKINKLVQLSELIKEHLDNNNYLTHDTKGKLIPDYLVAISKLLQEEQDRFLLEINNITTHLEHIKDIVAMQNDISGIAGIKENICLPEIVDLAIHMSSSQNSKSSEIEIIKDYKSNDYILSEKAKLLQILINLIKNAKDSVIFAAKNDMQIKISIDKILERNCIEIKVQDNGTGISNELLTKIFSLGFTTKSDGHGFGLHSSAIAAAELKGSLRAESEGINKGACFTVELPIIIEDNNNTRKSQLINTIN